MFIERDSRTVAFPLFRNGANSIVEVKIDNSLETSKDSILNKFSIEAELFDSAKWHDSDEYCDLHSSSVAHMELDPSSSTAIFGFLGYVLVGKLESPKLWSAEQPYLYTLVVILKDEFGKVVDCESCQVGIRQVSKAPKQLLVNGHPVILRGVNRHEHHPRLGKTNMESCMVKDLVLMKQNNINAVRNSHYPQHPRWYELCDLFGMYMIDEANIETHGWIRGRDSSRLLHYEGGGARTPSTDIVCPMYMRVWDIVKIAKDPTEMRPLILCEYSHSMGNSNGNIQEYWEAIDNTFGLQGGFIWDWVDQV
ncbi:Beta-galactosidase [Vitis vinifera]|uniref:beta-galactosidase n=1 Tax=Vitis vinifera TaxID=29760 RepID=A0A438GAT7_VITVI|nr:Beta-galactosidase [Vitis vinifera]